MCQVDELEQGIVIGKHALVLCHLSQLSVKALNRVGGVNNAAYRLAILDLTPKARDIYFSVKRNVTHIVLDNPFLFHKEFGN